MPAEATTANQASLFSLAGRVAIVTGGLGLLGREFCEALLEAGGDVVLADTDGPACRRRAEELALRFSRRVLGYEADITSTTSLSELRTAVLRTHGSFDVLINSAAINDVFSEGQADVESRFEHYPLALWKKSLDVNLTGTFLSCQVLGSVLAERGRGSIINIASTYGLVAPDQRIYRRADGSQTFWKSPVYAAGKGGVLALSRFLATYWAARSVRVNTLCPGGVEQQQEQHFIANYSARTPLGRMAQPREMRGAVVYLASEASSYMTGAELIVDGGWTAW